MFVELCGVKIYVEQRGQGPDVLLLHGWGCSTKLMDGVAEALADGMRVTCFDFPGHGQSGRPPQPWGVPEFAKLTQELIETFKIAPCDIVAHSFGGRVTLMLASTRPQLVGRVVLTGGAGLRAPQDEAGKKRSSAYKRLRSVVDAAGKVPVLSTAADHAREALIQRYGSADYKALDPEMRKTFVKVVNQDLRACLPGIKAPTLLYWGEQDDATPLWMGQAMEKEIPDAGLITVPGCGHFAYLEHLGEFTRIVRHFLLEDRRGER